ncbi:MAG: D-alanine--D-alanine ligase [Candidatus Shapirobacteria bacterium]|nr:D-alanine--D-alanine ligase [Candidatus Shapirobacteria bacterium]
MNEVVVLTGGKTPEYNVSLISAREVIKHFPKNYQPIPVIINKDNSCLSLVCKKHFLTITKDLAFDADQELVFPQAIKINWPDLVKIGKMVFIAIHGPFGEDGKIQGLLDLLELPYTGSGPLASALGINKLFFRKIMIAEKITIPKFVIYRSEENQEKIFNFLSLPLFVKPHNQGSSIGVSLVRKKSELEPALRLAQQFSDTILVDEMIQGKEIACGVIGNQKPQALPIAEIVPQEDFFDYQAKYQPKGAKEIIPAKINQTTTRTVQKLAIRIHQVLGCRGFSRTDFIINQNQKPVVLEINTIPGLTSQSILPKEAKTAGISYTEMIDKIIKLAEE